MPGVRGMHLPASAGKTEALIPLQVQVVGLWLAQHSQGEQRSRTSQAEGKRLRR